MRIYTRAGDDGTTGLYFGGRVRKDDASIELNGAVDEAPVSYTHLTLPTNREV